MTSTHRNAMRTKMLATAVVAVTATLAIAGCGGSDEGSPSAKPSGHADLSGKTAVFETFGGKFDESVKKAYVDPVVEKTGMKVSMDSPTDYAKLATQVKTKNPQWSVLMGDPFYAIQSCGKTVQPVDSFVDRAALDPKFVVSKCSVPGDQFSYTLMYDKKQFGEHPPTGWKDFFDVAKFPGKRAVFAGYVFNGMLEASLLGDGVAPADLYPLDVGRALKKLGTIKSDVKFADTLAAAQQLMEAGEVSMAVLPQENGLYAQQNGADFAPVFNQQITSWNDYLVPVGADLDKAKALLDSIASQSAQDQISSLDPVGNSLRSPQTPDSSALVATWSPLVKGRTDHQIVVDQAWWAKNLDAAQAKWTAFVSG